MDFIAIETSRIAIVTGGVASEASPWVRHACSSGERNDDQNDMVLTIEWAVNQSAEPQLTRP